MTKGVSMGGIEISVKGQQLKSEVLFSAWCTRRELDTRTRRSPGTESALVLSRRLCDPGGLPRPCCSVSPTLISLSSFHPLDVPCILMYLF